MSGTVDALVLDLLEWVGNGEKSYAEVMNAWRTSCPALPVWEEANDRGLIVREYIHGRGAVIKVTPSGRALLDHRRQSSASPRP